MLKYLRKKNLFAALRKNYFYQIDKQRIDH